MKIQKKDMNSIFYQDNWVTIYNDDCRNVLKNLPSNYVTCIITSPPYNVDIKYSNYKDNKKEEEYLNFLKEVFKECYRILVVGGRICVNVPSITKYSEKAKQCFLVLKMWNLLEKIGYIPRELITWVKIPIIKPEDYDDIDKHQGFPRLTSWGSWRSPSNPYLRNISEFIIIMEKEKSKLEGDKSKIDITRDEFLKFTNNCWFILPTNPKRSGHPAAFPPEIPYRLIKLYTYQENIVLDPFAGSGTTGYVAKRLKRKSIIIDISPEYCELAKKNCLQEFF